MRPNAFRELADEDLRALDEYKYSGSDLSLCSKYFMQRYWSAVVELVPKTVAPNMLTLLGFACSTSTSFLLLFFALTSGEFPNWIWAYAAIALFAYQTLDAIDGKQARRTGCGSPLGELFDHGCDALFTPMLSVTTCLAIGLTPMESFTYSFAVTTALYLALFEQCVTGTLDLGYINGPVEGILLSVLCLLFTSVVGPQWWATPFAAPLVDLGTSVFGVPLAINKPNDILWLVGVGAATGTGLVNIFNGFTHKTANKRVSRTMAFVPQFILGAGVLTLGLSAPHILRAPFPFALELAYGWLTSYAVTRLTVARLCRRKFDAFSMPYRVLLAVVATALGYQYFSTRPVNGTLVGAPLAFSAVFTVVCYLAMVAGVFTQIARYLKINVLTMTPEQRARNAKA